MDKVELLTKVHAKQIANSDYAENGLVNDVKLATGTPQPVQATQEVVPQQQTQPQAEQSQPTDRATHPETVSRIHEPTCS